MKPTAVEFAVEQLEQLIPFGHQLAIRIILEQAKEIEKEQQGYSEEEVQVKLYECLGHFAQKHNIIINGSEIDQWFEKFKNK